MRTETIDELVAKLKEYLQVKAVETGEYRAVDYVLRDRLERFTRNNETEDFEFIHGLIWGLYALGLINDGERNYIISDLIHNGR